MDTVKVDMVNESGARRTKFVRLAEGRTQAALSAIRKIGNLSNRRSYEWDAADVKKITVALQDAVLDLEQKFDPKSGGGHAEFHL